MNTGIFVLGLIILVLGIFAYGYSPDGFSFAFGGDDRPYYGLGILMLIVGLVLMIVGAFVSTTKEVVDEEDLPVRRTVVREEIIK